MRVYLAGPMRGIPESNYPLFKTVAQRLREDGHIVFSPVDWDTENHGPGGCHSESFDLRKALAADLEWICLEAEAVALLPGWQNSKGATAERATAIALGLAVFEVDGPYLP